MPSSNPKSILLQNGTILTHVSSQADKYHVVPLEKHSLLIVNDQIAEIAPQINTPPADTEIIDCEGKLISPGFIDTHHHVWQTQLKGRHADELLVDYILTGNSQSSNYEPDDVFWGQLGGCLEAIDSGSTCVVDHAHVNMSPDHSNAVLLASIVSGLRSFYCYSLSPRTISWNPFKMDPDLIPEWSLKELQRLASAQPFGNGRIMLGLGFDGLYMGKDYVTDLFQKVRGWGVKLITTHYLNNPVFGGWQSAISAYADYGLLGPDMLFSHANQPHDTDAALLKKHGGSVSSTPVIELQMGHGLPIAFDEGLYPHASLGVDCHSNQAADMLQQMRFALQVERGIRNQRFLDVKKNPKKLIATVEGAFNLGTILGARAVGMEDHIGSLTVGKKADVVIFDMQSPAMVCAAQQDPVAAIVMHASVQDIETVIVDGIVRKKDGKLLDLETTELEGLGGSYKPKIPNGKLNWKEIAKQLLKSREGIEKKIGQVDFVKAMPAMMEQYHIDPSGFADEV